MVGKSYKGYHLSKVKCTHCQLEFDSSIMIVESGAYGELHFCCSGCQGVYHLLPSDGFGIAFYEKGGEN